ncbi:MAG: hypothetical protein SFU99_03205 [Saprospiraceae bacterium]|nr:hypothetical protein [Saprospiraceae bacterium]
MSQNATFIKAFNAGYLLEKYVPKLSKLISNSLKDNATAFAQGFSAGSKQYLEEQTPKKSRLLEKLKADASKSPIPTKEKKTPDKEI